MKKIELINRIYELYETPQVDLGTKLTKLIKDLGLDND